MKFIHVADLHIGKIVNSFSMIEDQRYILENILKIAEEKKVDAILIAGDIYDKSIPSVESVELFDWFISEVALKKIILIAISGNHDSTERLSFGASIMKNQNIYFSNRFSGKLENIILKDEYGDIGIYLLPFIKPSNVRKFYENLEINNYQDAGEAIFSNENIDTSNRNIILAHQFITNNGVEPEKSDSEIINVGGIDNIDFSVFKDFDYVALGHIHKSQFVGRNEVRYSGSPLKYSFSEVNHVKSLIFLEMKTKGDLTIEKIPLVPMRDMRKITGFFEEIKEHEKSEDYVHVTLKDEFLLNPMERLRIYYPNLMQISFDNKKTKIADTDFHRMDISNIDISELFKKFYHMQNDKELDNEKLKIIKSIFEEVGDDVK